MASKPFSPAEIQQAAKALLEPPIKTHVEGIDLKRAYQTIIRFNLRKRTNTQQKDNEHGQKIH